MRINKLAVAALWLSIFFTSAGEARPSCEVVFADHFESAVEVEIGATPKVMELFTTKDGTLHPVAGEAGEKAIPEKLLEQIKEVLGPGVDPLDASWDLLSPEEQMEVISRAGEINKHDFYKNRSVPGLVYREAIELEFAKPTRFLGQTFSRGRHLVATNDIFGDTKIEFMGQNRIAKDLGFELHVRSSKSAGENKLTAESLQKALLGVTQHMHEHITAPYPDHATEGWIRRLIRKLGLTEKIPTPLRPVDTYRMAEFVRRTNLYFDLKMIENGTKMTVVRNSDGESSNFFPSSPLEFMRFVGAAHYQAVKATSKAGSVGVRTHHYYDRRVWGIEVRYLSPRLHSEKTARVLDFIQHKMVSGEFYVSEEVAARLAPGQGYRAAVAMSKEVEKLLYSSGFAAIDAKGGSMSFDKAAERGFVKDNDFVKMLYHDWSQDPMFVDRPQRVAQIREAQEFAKKLLFHKDVKGDKPVDTAEVMQIFMRKSGIAQDLNRFFEGQSVSN